MAKQEAQFTVYADDSGTILVNRGDKYDAQSEAHVAVAKGNPDVFPDAASGIEPGPNAAPETPEPPSGNAGAEKWREYARSVGVEVAEDASRDDVKVALVGAGIIQAAS